MSKVIIQPTDWPDWYKLRAWMDEHCPGEYVFKTLAYGVPAAFEYPQEHQSALHEFLYPSPEPELIEEPPAWLPSTVEDVLPAVAEVAAPVADEVVQVPVPMPVKPVKKAAGRQVSRSR